MKNDGNEGIHLQHKDGIWGFAKRYPIPIFTFLCLITGGVFYFAMPHSSAANWIWFAALVLGGLPIAYKTFIGMLKGQFASDVIAMLAIVTAILMEQSFAGAVVVLMQSGGEALEDFGFRRATITLASLIARAPKYALRKTADRVEKITVQKIQVGDTLVVRTGDLVPADGTILSGNSEIDESALTGEPLARSKSAGDAVLSGSVDVNGTFEMRADKPSHQSQYAKIVEMVKKAQQEKAPIQRLADRYAVYFTPLTLAMAALGFWITGSSETILSVLVVATPCPLILATPLAVFSGINKAAETGIIVKGGTPMEQVGSARAVLFDKTGTITYGTPFVEEIIPLANEKPEDLLYQAAIVEQLSSHSIAKAIVDKALEKFPHLPLPASSTEDPGRGVKGSINGDQITIGSALYLQQEIGKECLQNFHPIIDRYYKQEKVLNFIAKNGQCIGFFVLSDRIRPGIPKMIHDLHSLGVKEIVMLTGDGIRNAEIIARQAEIKNFKADLTPEQKVETVKKLETQFPPVIMVGDGINDAPALAAATVGIAMGAYGSAISAETADIVLLEDDPTKIVETITISRRMLYIAKQSILIGIGLSFALMVVAIFGKIAPAIGALLQEIIDVAVILNALRAR